MFNIGSGNITKSKEKETFVKKKRINGDFFFEETNYFKTKFQKELVKPRKYNIQCLLKKNSLWEYYLQDTTLYQIYVEIMGYCNKEVHKYFNNPTIDELFYENQKIRWSFNSSENSLVGAKRINNVQNTKTVLSFKIQKQKYSSVSGS